MSFDGPSSGQYRCEGDEAFNQQLSLDRAQAVKDWLIKAGTPSERITIRGAGGADAIALSWRGTRCAIDRGPRQCAKPIKAHLVRARRG